MFYAFLKSKSPKHCSKNQILWKTAKMAKFHDFRAIFNTKYLTETWLTALFDPMSAGVSMVSRVGAKDVYKTLQRTLTYLRENILEPLSIIQSPKVYGWLQSQHPTQFLKDFPYKMAPTSRLKGGSTSKKVKIFKILIFAFSWLEAWVLIIFAWKKQFWKFQRCCMRF